MFHLMLATCMAENSESFCREIARFIKRPLHISTGYVGGIPWQERERMFDDGEIHVLWICGFPYVEKAGRAMSAPKLRGVPIPRGERYQGGRMRLRSHTNDGAHGRPRLVDVKRHGARCCASRALHSQEELHHGQS